MKGFISKSCSSSEMTLQETIERSLKRHIPSVQRVESVDEDGEALSEAAVERVLDAIRPFLKVAKGDIKFVKFQHLQGLLGVCYLELQGKMSKNVTTNIKTEIVDRLKSKFPSISQVIITGP
eukprot:Platyproteum_vivax@DN4005_c0_g1_i2.p2